jgi:GT2 family glycosyltransferase
VNNPVASVVIVNFNTFLLTCACIQSVLDQTKGLSYEIIVVDNNSSDVSPAAFSRQFPTIKVIPNHTNVGFAKANNIGIAHALGQYILLLNSDTVLTNDAITISRNFLEDHKHIGAVTARLEYPDGTIQHNCQRFPSIRFALFELLRLQKMFPKISQTILFGPFFSYNKVAFPDWIWGTFFMFNKNLLKVLPGGKLRDDFFMYGEDMQWCMELKRCGYSVAIVPEARVIHYMGKSGGNKLSLMRENQEIFMRTYYNLIHRKLIALLTTLLRLGK